AEHAPAFDARVLEDAAAPRSDPRHGRHPRLAPDPAARLGTPQGGSPPPCPRRRGEHALPRVAARAPPRRRGLLRSGRGAGRRAAARGRGSERTAEEPAMSAHGATPAPRKAVGIDIGGTKIALATVAGSGEIVREATIPTRSEEGFASAFPRMA